MGERKLFLDIETTEITNGSELPNKIFCLVTICDKGNLVCYSPNDLHKFQNDAKNYQEFIGHNIIGFDAPVIKKVLGDGFTINGNSYDELLDFLKNDQELQKTFSNFMEKVISRVLNNLNINLPFNRSEIIQKN